MYWQATKAKHWEHTICIVRLNHLSNVDNWLLVFILPSHVQIMQTFGIIDCTIWFGIINRHVERNAEACPQIISKGWLLHDFFLQKLDCPFLASFKSILFANIVNFNIDRAIVLLTLWAFCRNSNHVLSVTFAQFLHGNRHLCFRFFPIKQLSFVYWDPLLTYLS